MARARLDNWLEKGLLGLVLAILVTGPLATGLARAQDFAIAQGLIGGVLILWLGRIWLQPARFFWPPVCWAVVAFAGYAIVRYLQADIEYVAREELIRILTYAFLFLAVINNIQRQEHGRILIFALIAVAIFVSLYAVFQVLTDSDQVWHFIRPLQYGRRGSGTYINPNHAAGFLEMILPLGLAFALIGRQSHVTRIFLGYGTVVVLAGIVATVSRGGWIATVLSLLIFFAVLLRRPVYRLPALALLGVFLAAAIFIGMRGGHLQKRFEQTVASGKVEDLRFQVWAPAIRLWRENFWWGVGPAHFDYRFRAYRPELVQVRPDRVHNDYLNTLVDWGTAGAVLVAAAWLLFFGGVVQTWRQLSPTRHDLNSGKSNRLALLLGGSVGLLALLFHSVVDFNLHVPANAITAVTLMALLTGLFRHVNERLWIPAGLTLRLLATAICLTGVVYLSNQGFRRVQEQQLLQRAARAPAASSEQMHWLEAAHAVEPMNFDTTYKLGEARRRQSWEGRTGYQRLAQEAMGWFTRGMELNPYDGYNFFRYGMCLHLIGRSDEAAPYFRQAEALDPNNYFLLAHVGWHYLKLEDLVTAKAYFERSLRIRAEDNTIAASYLGIIERRLREQGK
jgi:O-antigen ligase